MWTRTKTAVNFVKASLDEDPGELANPGRGWYHIYTLSAQPPPQPIPLEHEIWFYDNASQEKLALALIDISAFRLGRISANALSRIDNILHFFEAAGKQVILRFVYDTQGHCILTEPPALSTVKLHMEQIGPLIQKHSRNVLVAQGLFLGNWGEMHGSRYSTGPLIGELAATFLEATDGCCFVAMRTPSMIRMLLDGKELSCVMQKKLAVFNDGMFASKTDLGTYGVATQLCPDGSGKWTREEELEWQQANLCFAPNGGESAAQDPTIGFREAAAEMRLAHTAYLNRAYHPAQLDYWRQERIQEKGVWNDVNGFDYIGRHLGYRFVVRNVYAGKKKELLIEVENCGFANLCQEADCFLIFEGSDGQSFRRCLPTDPRRWMRSKRTLVPTHLHLKGSLKPGTLYLSLRLKADSTPITFANLGASDKLKIGELTDLKRSQGHTVHRLS